MAVITSFRRDTVTNPARHRTEVEARIFTFGGGRSGPITQINTYGSASREFPGKISQTIHLDRAAAETLWKILSEEYGFRS